MNKKNLSAQGFTLIELLVVVAILSILSAIGLTKFYVYRQRAFNAVTREDLKNSISAQEAYYADGQTYLSCATAEDCATDLPGFRPSRDTSSGTPQNSIFRHQARQDGQSYTATAQHSKSGTLIDFDSLTGTMSDN